MGHERAAVVSAIQSTPNLGEAARKLGASRRTLQNRMREYGLPHGKDGRPRHVLPTHGSSGAGSVLGFVALAAGAVIGWNIYAKISSTRVAGSAASEYLRGIDAELR